MAYGALTLDTSIFNEKGLNLESGILKTLDQFKEMPTSLILSEIIAREVHAHLKKKSKDARASLTKVIQESLVSLSVTEANAEIAMKALIPGNDDHEVAKNRLDKFIKNTGTKIIPASDRVQLDEVIQRYFNAEPPFEDNGKKKNEFPDAIALLSLESWAKENDTKILAVSKDNDWKRFADTSDVIDVVEDLAEAISVFQLHSAAVEYCSTISSLLTLGQPEELYQQIEECLAEQISELDLYPDADCMYFFEPDFVEVALETFEIKTRADGKAVLLPLYRHMNEITAETKIFVKASASTTFSMLVRDSIDKDYIPIGSTDASTEIEFEAEALLTFEGNFEKGIEHVNLTNFVLQSYPRDVDFGHIEPDWQDDEY